MRFKMKGYNRLLMRAALAAVAVVLLTPPAVRAQGGPMAVKFYHLDAQGNVLAVTDWDGNEVESHDYDVFGQEVSPEPGIQPLRFTGKERDAETGWDYFGARYYGSNVGRFTSADPLLNIRANLVHPQAWNRYSYAVNNPLRYTDPDGRCVDAISCVVLGGIVTWVEIGAFFTSATVAGTMAANAPAIVEATASGSYVSYPGVDIHLDQAMASYMTGDRSGSPGFVSLSKKTEGSGPKASDATGVTAGGQATDQYGNKLGPSGKPMVHETESTTREEARNKALNEGSGALNHNNPAEGKPHFHPADAEGAKKPNSTHHNYPE